MCIAVLSFPSSLTWEVVTGYTEHAVHLSCTEWNEFRLLSAGLSTFVVRGEGKGLIPQSVAWTSWGMLLLQRGKEWSCPQRRREEIQHVGCRSVQPTAGMLRPSTWLCSISFVVWSHPSRKVLEVFCNCFFFFLFQVCFHKAWQQNADKWY